MTVATKKKKIFDGRYEILEIVGRGSRSVVYHARLHDDPSEEVALKVLLAGADIEDTRLRLRNEALAMVTCQHPYVVRLNDFHAVDELMYLSLEYAAEADLRKYLAKDRSKFNGEIAEIYFKQLAEALYFIHSVGVVHRDVKPDNILVINEHEVRLGDFGVAVLPGDHSTAEELKAAVGTMNYLAPEVLKGEAYDGRADIYSLALSFYEILLGKNPFEGLSMAEQMSVRMQPLPPIDKLVPGLSPRFAKTLMKALNPELSSRLSTAKEILDLLGSDTEKLEVITNEDDAELEHKSDEFEVDQTQVFSKENIEEENKEVPSEKLSSIEPEESYGDVAKTIVVDNSSLFTNPEQSSRKKQSTSGFITRDIIDRVRAEAVEEDVIQEKPAKEEPPVKFTPPLFKEKQKEVKKEPAQKRSPKQYKIESKITPAKTSQSKPLRSRVPFLLVIGAVASAMILFGAIQGLFSTHKVQKVADKNITVPIKQNNSNSEAFNFPILTKGTYSGVISGLQSREVPISLVSFGEGRTVLLLGIEGWTPTLAQVKGNELIFFSNGWVIRLNGGQDGAKLVGAIENIVSGAVGTWEVARVKS